jgi:energy-converting hydrogenase Eha subunit C
MAATSNDARATAEELREHEETFRSFNKLVLFAILHVGLVLACLALAFLGQVPLLALLIGLGGTIAMVVGFVIAG